MFDAGEQADDMQGEMDSAAEESVDSNSHARHVEFVVHGGHTVPPETAQQAMTEESERALDRFLDGDPRIPDDLRVRVVPAGRRAVGPALVFRLLGTGGTVDGEVTSAATDAKRTMAAWRLLRSKLPEGQLPILSLGAVRLLCVGDLEHRLGTLAGVRLLWCDQLDGDPVSPGRAQDLFGVVFVRDTALWCYLVDALGEIVHFGEGMRPV